MSSLNSSLLESEDPDGSKGEHLGKEEIQKKLEVLTSEMELCRMILTSDSPQTVHLKRKKRGKKSRDVFNIDDEDDHVIDLTIKEIEVLMKESKFKSVKDYQYFFHWCCKELIDSKVCYSTG